MIQIRTSLLAFMLAFALAPGLNAQEPGGVVKYLPVFASVLVGVMGGFGSAVLDAKATDTTMAANVWTMTFFGEGVARAWVVQTLFKLSGATSEAMGHSISRIASYVAYYFTYNKGVSPDRRMRAIRCLEIFFESLAYRMVIAAAEHIRTTST